MKECYFSKVVAVTLLHGCFSRFLICTNDTTSQKASHILTPSANNQLKFGPCFKVALWVKVLQNNLNFTYFFIINLNFMAPFLWMGFNCLKATEPLRGDSLLFTTKSPGVPSTHFIVLRRMKGCVDLGATWWFWTGDPWIRNPMP